jgi:hypothetical protein
LLRSAGTGGRERQDASGDERIAVSVTAMEWPGGQIFRTHRDLAAGDRVKVGRIGTTIGAASPRRQYRLQSLTQP